MAANILFCLFIADGLVCGCFVDLVNYLFDGRPDLVVLHNLLGGISKEYVHSCRVHPVFLQSPAFADTALEQVPLDGSLEELFRNRHHDSVIAQTVFCQVAETKTRNIPVLAVGKQLRYSGFAAKPLFFRESMADLAVHF